MKNQVYSGTPTSRRFGACPTTIVAGDAVLIGNSTGVDMPAVALNSYSAATGGAVFSFSGSFNLTVIGATVVSPQTPAAIPPGGRVYGTGTRDATTGVTYGLTLSATPGDQFFGFIDPSYVGGVSSGATDTAAVVKLAGCE
jgi:hypothetical protein